MLDLFQGVMPASFIASFFFPALLLLLLSQLNVLTPDEDPRIPFLSPMTVERPKAIVEELRTVNKIFSRLRHYDDKCDGLLPTQAHVDELIQHWTDCMDDMGLLKDGKRYKIVMDKLLMEELLLVGQRPCAADHMPELQKCLAQQHVADTGDLSDMLVEVFHKEFMKHSQTSTFRDRALFATQYNNYLGLGHKSLLPGDQIWLLNGAPSPFILRPKPNGNFEFLGEAYVQGIMLGEAKRKNGIDGGQDRRIWIE